MIPFAAWTARNWRVFQVVEPLAPRYANDPDEVGDPGWQRWVKTWCLDFISTYDIYWNVPGGPFDLSKLPAGPSTRRRSTPRPPRWLPSTTTMGRILLPGMDARFARLAEERIAAHPLRYYLWLPLGRLADMWLRPRIENLPIDLDWWVYAHHNAETRFSWAYAGLNAALSAAGVGWVWSAAAVLAVDAVVYGAAERVADDYRSAGDALYAGVFSHAFCAGRSCGWVVVAEDLLI